MEERADTACHRMVDYFTVTLKNNDLRMAEILLVSLQMVRVLSRLQTTYRPNQVINQRVREFWERTHMTNVIMETLARVAALESRL